MMWVNIVPNSMCCAHTQQQQKNREKKIKWINNVRMCLCMQHMHARKMCDGKEYVNEYVQRVT